MKGELILVIEFVLRGFKLVLHCVAAFLKARYFAAEFFLDIVFLALGRTQGCDLRLPGGALFYKRIYALLRARGGIPERLRLCLEFYYFLVDCGVRLFDFLYFGVQFINSRALRLFSALAVLNDYVLCLNILAFFKNGEVNLVLFIGGILTPGGKFAPRLVEFAERVREGGNLLLTGGD